MVSALLARRCGLAAIDNAGLGSRQARVRRPSPMPPFRAGGHRPEAVVGLDDLDVVALGDARGDLEQTGAAAFTPAIFGREDQERVNAHGGDRSLAGGIRNQSCRSPSPCRRLRERKVRDVPSGRVKSITQSAAPIAAATSSVMSARWPPAISPASRPMKGVALRSVEGGEATPSSFSAASISILPMRPGAPAIATRIWDIGLFSHRNGPARRPPGMDRAPPQRARAGGGSRPRASAPAPPRMTRGLRRRRPRCGRASPAKKGGSRSAARRHCRPEAMGRSQRSLRNMSTTGGQHVAHLIAGHAAAKLRDHLTVDVIALADVDPVGVDQADNGVEEQPPSRPEETMSAARRERMGEWAPGCGRGRSSQLGAKNITPRSTALDRHCRRLPAGSCLLRRTP